MELEVLTVDERTALVGLARYLVDLDGEVSDSELYDLLALGFRIGRDEFAAALEATEASHRVRTQTLDLARTVERRGAQQRILLELDRIANGDGLHEDEDRFLNELRANWPNADAPSPS